MKKAILFIIILAASVGIGFADNISIINGIWNRGIKDRSIKLFKVEDGALKEMASYKLEKDNKFYFAFEAQQESFYVVGSNSSSAFNNYTFYFKPGDCLNLEVDNKSYKLVGKNTPENEEMAKWHELLLPMERKSQYFMAESSTYVDFFPLLDEKLEVVNNYVVSYTSNATFKVLFDAYRKYDLLYNALNFLLTPRSAHPQGEDFSDYYKNVNLADITSNETLLKYPYGMSIIRSYSTIAPTIRADKYTAEQVKDLRGALTSLDVLLPEIKNEKIKGEVILQQSRFLKSYDGFLDFEQKYGKYLVTEVQKERLQNMIKDVADLSQGQMAIDFKFPDINGKETALSDFKGKVVYIDVWATWCGPCIKEIPALKKLEEEYHGQDIVFLSVGTDVSKDIQKWKDFIKQRELKGVQLFAGDRAKKELMEIYKITGIPRFILVGKDGSLVSADAPRPSSTEIKVLLDATLKKK